jgi:hypothetical protein
MTRACEPTPAATPPEQRVHCPVLAVGVERSRRAVLDQVQNERGKVAGVDHLRGCVGGSGRKHFLLFGHAQYPVIESVRVVTRPDDQARPDDRRALATEGCGDGTLRRGLESAVVLHVDLPVQIAGRGGLDLRWQARERCRLFDAARGELGIRRDARYEYVSADLRLERTRRIGDNSGTVPTGVDYGIEGARGEQSVAIAAVCKQMLGAIERRAPGLAAMQDGDVMTACDGPFREKRPEKTSAAQNQDTHVVFGGGGRVSDRPHPTDAGARSPLDT